MPFLVVDLPAAGLVLPKLTADHPGSTVDVVLVASESQPKGLVHTHLVRFQGLPPGEVERAMQHVQSRYGTATSVARNGGNLVATMVSEETEMSSPVARAVLRLQHEHLVPWTCVDGGRISLRGPIYGDPEAAEEAIAARLAEVGLKAKVSARKLSIPEVERWESLRSDALRAGGQHSPVWQKVERVLAARLGQLATVGMGKAAP